MKLLAVLLLLAASRALGIVAYAQGPAIKASDYTLSGPFTHGNLTLFLIHAPIACPACAT